MHEVTDSEVDRTKRYEYQDTEAFQQKWRTEVQGNVELMRTRVHDEIQTIQKEAMTHF